MATDNRKFMQSGLPLKNSNFALTEYRLCSGSP